MTMTTDQIIDLNFSTRLRSPREEFAHRLLSVLPPLQLPDALAALIMQHQGRKQVSRNGLAFDYQGKTFGPFWHENSITCLQMIGAEVRYTFDPCNPLVVYVLAEDGAFIEAIPAKGKVPWFDPARASEELNRHKQVQRRLLDAANETHAATRKDESARVLANNEKLRLVNTFPVPTRSSRGDEALNETRSFEAPAASRISEAQTDFSARQTSHVEQKERSEVRVSKVKLTEADRECLAAEPVADAPSLIDEFADLFNPTPEQPLY